MLETRSRTTWTPNLGCKFIENTGSCRYEGERRKEKRCTSMARISFNSVIANVCAMQFRGPPPKGLNANRFEQAFAIPLANRSGLNSRASSPQYCFSRWTPRMSIMMTRCFDNGSPRSVVLLFTTSRYTALTGLYNRRLSSTNISSCNIPIDQFNCAQRTRSNVHDCTLPSDSFGISHTYNECSVSVMLII